MEDEEIVNLYWKREERAIEETDKKYGNYCWMIARNILHRAEDAEECVNDTYWKTWKSIPPYRPERFSAFLGKITRNLSFQRYEYYHRKKRGAGEIDLVLDELEPYVSGMESVEEQVLQKELVREINDFLGTLPKQKRMLFVRRYWYVDSISDLAEQFHMTKNHVSVVLLRIRKKLFQHLEERGFDL